MKTALIFVGLKITEIVGFMLVFTSVSYATTYFGYDQGFWLNGMWGMLMILLGILLGSTLVGVMFGVVAKNIEWAKKLSKGEK